MSQYVDFYSGTEVRVILLKGLLEEEGIPTIMMNDFNSGNIGGFLGGTPSTVRLRVRSSDMERAKSILEGFERAEEVWNLDFSPVYYPDGTATQRISIVPDVEVKPSVKGIREGRDELLEKAVEIITKKTNTNKDIRSKWWKPEPVQIATTNIH